LSVAAALVVLALGAADLPVVVSAAIAAPAMLREISPEKTSLEKLFIAVLLAYMDASLGNFIHLGSGACAPCLFHVQRSKFNVRTGPRHVEAGS
jgi:hypothetical protein